MTNTYRGDSWGEAEAQPVEIGEMAGIRLIADRGSCYNSAPRLYMKKLSTGEEKIIAIKVNSRNNYNRITTFLLRLAPRNVLFGCFSGKSINLDFDREGFSIDGKLVPFKHVIHIYRNDECREVFDDVSDIKKAKRLGLIRE